MMVLSVFKVFFLHVLRVLNVREFMSITFVIFCVVFSRSKACVLMFFFYFPTLNKVLLYFTLLYFTLKNPS